MNEKEREREREREREVAGEWDAVLGVLFFNLCSLICKRILLFYVLISVLPALGIAY